MAETKHQDGVAWSGTNWEAWLSGKLIAVGPDRELIEAAYTWHRNEQEGVCPDCGAHTYHGRLVEWECSRCDWISL